MNMGRLMTRTLLGSVALAATAIGVSQAPAAQGTLVVTSDADSGPGSLRAALQDAAQSTDPVSILITTNGNIEISSTLTYAGRMPLSLFGDGQTVRTDANVTILKVSEGADLTVVDLNFRGPGGFSIEDRGDADGPGGKGIFVDVREDQDGIVNLELQDVDVSGVAYHGIHVSDCDLADDCGGGSGGGGDGSAASIVVRLNDVEVEDVGNGRFDADGVRIDERGPGSIYFTSIDSDFEDVGADGVELDEGHDGDVVALVVGSSFVDNGGYCDGKILESHLPDPAEAEFKDGEAAESDVPGPVTGSMDDGCFEREVDLFPSGSVEAYEFSIDFDDGLDIDEAGAGGLRIVMVESEVHGNLDEGVDLDELDDGAASVTFIETHADENTDDGIRTSEAGAGDLEGLVFDSVVRENGGNGIRMEQEDAGNLNVLVTDTRTAKNDDGDDTGIRVTQAGDGTGVLTLRYSDIEDGIDARNVDVVEQ